MAFDEFDNWPRMYGGTITSAMAPEWAPYPYTTWNPNTTAIDRNVWSVPITTAVPTDKVVKTPSLDHRAIQ